MPEKNQQSFPQAPASWRQQLKEFSAAVQKEGVDIVDPETEKLKKTLSVLLLPKEKNAQVLFNFVRQSIPDSLKSKVFLQPSEGYHATIQWSDELNFTDDLTTDIKNSFSDFPTVNTDVYGLYLSQKNLFLIPDVSDYQISDFRQNVSEIFSQHQLSPKLPPDLPAIWISAVRFTKQLSSQELQQLPHLAREKFSVNFDRLVLAKNDPFFTPKSSQIISLTIKS